MVYWKHNMYELKQHTNILLVLLRIYKIDMGCVRMPLFFARGMPLLFIKLEGYQKHIKKGFWNDAINSNIKAIDAEVMLQWHGGGMKSVFVVFIRFYFVQVICVTVDLTHNHVKPITFVHLDQNSWGLLTSVWNNKNTSRTSHYVLQDKCTPLFNSPCFSSVMRAYKLQIGRTKQISIYLLDTSISVMTVLCISLSIF